MLLPHPSFYPPAQPRPLDLSRLLVLPKAQIPIAAPKPLVSQRLPPRGASPYICPPVHPICPLLSHLWALTDSAPCLYKLLFLPALSPPQPQLPNPTSTPASPPPAPRPPTAAKLQFPSAPPLHLPRGPAPGAPQQPLLRPQPPLTHPQQAVSATSPAPTRALSTQSRSLPRLGVQWGSVQMGMGEGAGTFNSPSSAILRHRRRRSPSPSSGPGTGAQLSTPAPAANAACSAPSGPLHLPFPAPPARFRMSPSLSPSLHSRTQPLHVFGPVCKTGRLGGCERPEGSRTPRGKWRGGGSEVPEGRGGCHAGVGREMSF